LRIIPRPRTTHCQWLGPGLGACSGRLACYWSFAQLLIADGAAFAKLLLASRRQSNSSSQCSTEGPRTWGLDGGESLVLSPGIFGGKVQKGWV
jgi:hypothetical protein